MRTLLVASAMVLAASSQAVIIYDSLAPAGTGYTLTSGVPRNFIADTFNTISAPSGQTWQVNQVLLPIIVATAGTYDITFRVRFYDTVQNVTSGTTDIFSDLVSDVTWSATISASTTYTLPYLATGNQFQLATGQLAGFSVQILNNGQANSALTLGMTDNAPAVGNGTASNWFYRDADSNGFINGSDARSFANWTNNNTGIQIDAEAVPEPATMTILGLGLAAAALKRRKKA